MDSSKQTDTNPSREERQVQGGFSGIQWYRHVRSRPLRTYEATEVVGKHDVLQYSWKSEERSRDASVPRYRTEIDPHLFGKWLQHLYGAGSKAEDPSRQPRSFQQHLILPLQEETIDSLGQAVQSDPSTRSNDDSDGHLMHSALAIRTRAGEDSRSNNHGNSGSRIQQHISLNQGHSSKKRRARQEHDGRQNDDEDEGDGDGDVPKLAITIANPNDPKTPMFACPFHKRFHREDLEEDRLCSRGSWKKFHRVKCATTVSLSRLSRKFAEESVPNREHVFRKHRLPPHQCPRCLRLFEGRDDLATHLREPEPCGLLQDYEAPVGVTPDQLEKLKRRKSGISDEQRWIDMYKILFPDVLDDEIPTPWYERWQSPVADDATMFQSLRDGYRDMLCRADYRLKLQTKIWDVVCRDTAVLNRQSATSRITTAILEFQLKEFDCYIKNFERPHTAIIPGARNMRYSEEKNEQESHGRLHDNVAFSPTLFPDQDHFDFLDFGPLPETCGNNSLDTDFLANPSPKSLAPCQPPRVRVFEYPMQDNGPVWLGT
ncbi:hypothetical protein GGR57DRAFT_517375 [Xylariaceae sp. FL1272]|nr:hypothetical protein GGR57DRAFT_517375 [Xylariaceae sp. FL1272]